MNGSQWVCDNASLLIKPPEARNRVNRPQSILQGQFAIRIFPISLAQLSASRQHTFHRTHPRYGPESTPQDRNTQVELFIMKVAVSSVSPYGPSITHYNLTKLGVCVPVHWSTTQAIEYAQSKLRCVNNFHWTPQTETETDTPIVHACEMEQGFKHITLTIEPDSSSAPTAVHSTRDEPTINARVIINLEDTHVDRILKTAQSIQLLSEYLQVKAAAATARNNHHHDEATKQEALAEQLNSRLLAQFEGTLVFV